jgi:hypothetical protein
MNQAMTQAVLGRENQAFRGRGGVSAETRPYGFRPAFLDSDTGEVYASCYADGQPAVFHLLDGLPQDLIVARHPTGRVTMVKNAITSGFVREGTFYTREEAAQAVMPRQ